MTVLLYCSFSVPLAIAFSDSSPNAGLDALDIAIDAVFFIDILLNFLTARISAQGAVITDLRLIASSYLRSWFLLDFAGTFPFDTVAAARLGAGGSLGGMRLIRMTKLVRALRFMSKLNTLKDREGFEAFGAAIGILAAVFILFFTAHLLGCFFVMMVQYEPGDNWMTGYDPDLLVAGSEIQYGARIRA
jgi:hypothetical protein